MQLFHRMTLFLAKIPNIFTRTDRYLPPWSVYACSCTLQSVTGKSLKLLGLPYEKSLGKGGSDIQRSFTQFLSALNRFPGPAPAVSCVHLSMSDETLNDFMRWDFGSSRPWRLQSEEKYREVEKGLREWRERRKEKIAKGLSVISSSKWRFSVRLKTPDNASFRRCCPAFCISA
ncbi:hypothetical protein CEXT_726631 [Caerostris extrusa]|uniref:Uncharacterized protein n=1 Tax=Caerostris extrusa TaxID=172846 RepID=A0AAV4XBT2_CAEEX|nr:hypothetical protein CEXT_726631 [Caerostris extrusa]